MKTIIEVLERRWVLSRMNRAKKKLEKAQRLFNRAEVRYLQAMVLSDEGMPIDVTEDTSYTFNGNANNLFRHALCQH